MAVKVYPSKDGFSISGMAPPEVVASHGFFSTMFYEWVLEFTLKRKDKELSQGRDKDGAPLRPISAETRRHRVSAMTPSGRGDPSAPPLDPGRQKSRTRSLLTGRAYSDHVEMWWKYDPFTRASWARVLEHQAEQGRDVFGLSPEGVKWVQAQALKRWEAYKRGKVVKPVVPLFGGIPQVGEEVISAAPLRGMTSVDWARHFRTPARVPIPGRKRLPYNILLRHIYGRLPKLAPPSRMPIPITPPRPIKIVAMKPMAITAKPVPSGLLGIMTPAQQSAFRAEVMAAAHEVEQFYEGKVFIHHVWAELIKDPKYATLTLEQFKALLLSDPAFRALMARADLIQAMSPADIIASQVEIKIGGKTAAEFNFLRVAKKRR
jgi:hypothetical protein